MPTAMVTGANRGIGLEMVRQLLDRDYEVHATYRSAKGGLGDINNPRLTLHRMDVRNTDEVVAAVGAVGLSLDLLVNNAGVADGRWSTIAEIDFNIVSDVMEINAIAPVRVTQHALPLLANDGGTVLMITSLMGSIGDCASGRSYAYRASKTALNMFTTAMKNELRDQGISLLLIHPGWVETDMGGPNAPLSVEESVEGIMARVDEQTLDMSGRFVDYAGTHLPW
ncbi:MAG: SDR family NAD(P)-dependent oxidoreductase [Candidatus Poseidoniales archaeon]|nr:MAG: SDR family NAD(P)-dependent oxidoreductase [Candidatus Poseidoniales archaeon]